MFDAEARLESHFSDTAQRNKGVKVSEDLRRVYEKNGRRLSQNATVFPSKKYGDWLIVDKNQNRKYAVRKNEGQLKVYMVEPRLAGTFKMPNDLGAYLVIVLPMVIGYFVTSLGLSERSGRVPRNWKLIAVLGGSFMRDGG